MTFYQLTPKKMCNFGHTIWPIQSCNPPCNIGQSVQNANTCMEVLFLSLLYWWKCCIHCSNLFRKGKVGWDGFVSYFILQTNVDVKVSSFLSKFDFLRCWESTRTSRFSNNFLLLLYVNRGLKFACILAPTMQKAQLQYL